MNYQGKRVVVTGCASGIGAATAALLARLGAEVHGLDRAPAGTDLAAYHVVDLADPATIDVAVDGIGGQVDALFNCAGLSPTRPPLDVLTVNFLGTRYLTDRVLGLMPDGGAIVSTASNGGARWRSHIPALLELVAAETFADGLAWLRAHEEAWRANAYAYSKEAMIVWTLRQSATLIKRGIRINCTSPGTVQTPMLDDIERQVPADRIDVVSQPIGRRSTPEEQAWPLVLLNSDACGYINGVDLAVDGGFAALGALRV